MSGAFGEQPTRWLVIGGLLIALVLAFFTVRILGC